ncbi:hypothetical protein BGZ97_011045 [Linnemannia gamsii]|jgi:hypothetical protein|uniref:Uncharacterized protein n=1 Tax=Linnemannia gamsii TaxID=64522 RepID=A0A9P6RN88_9FUNG|nr:hypothetical protein BGZ97_011045 [Linnemannia gamsii]
MLPNINDASLPLQLSLSLKTLYVTDHRIVARHLADLPRSCSSLEDFRCQNVRVLTLRESDHAILDTLSATESGSVSAGTICTLQDLPTCKRFGEAVMLTQTARIRLDRLTGLIYLTVLDLG